MAGLGLAGVAALALGALCLGSGCADLGYYRQTVAGHVDLMTRAKPVDDWLAGSDTPAALKQRLEQTARRDPETELQLRADTAVPYGRVVQLIGMAQTVGLSRIGFVADPVTGAPATAAPAR